MAQSLKGEMGVPVLCSLSGEDIFLDALPDPFRTEAFRLVRDGARNVDGFVSPTRYFASHAATHFGLNPARIHHVPMGIHVDDTGSPRFPSAVEGFSIGYLARICPEKGLMNLCEAFVRLRNEGRACRLKAAGYLGAADRPYFRKVIAYLRSEGVEDEFDYAGEVSRDGKFDFLRALHLFSVPTVYPEAKGLYILEAMACGVSVVQPDHGSFPELIRATGGGIPYPANDSDALAGAIARLMDDPVYRRELGAAGRKAVRESFTDEIMAENTWALYQQFVTA
jgi:glycosyltransferase involved in cell wall biosynthesis